MLQPQHPHQKVAPIIGHRRNLSGFVNAMGIAALDPSYGPRRQNCIRIDPSTVSGAPGQMAFRGALLEKISGSGVGTAHRMCRVDSARGIRWAVLTPPAIIPTHVRLP